jgi:predicted phosphoribosyltransferase
MTSSSGSCGSIRRYEDFRQTSDDEVVALLQQAANPAAGEATGVAGQA